MKKLLSILAIFFVFVMQSFTLVPGMTPVLLRVKEPKINGTIPGPSRSQGSGMEATIEVYLNETSDSLLLYSPSELSCFYNIYDVDELDVCNGNVIFSEQGEASIYLGSLNEGTYSISLVVDTLVYVGEFDKN